MIHAFGRIFPDCGVKNLTQKSCLGVKFIKFWKDKHQGTVALKDEYQKLYQLANYQDSFVE